MRLHRSLLAPALLAIVFSVLPLSPSAARSEAQQGMGSFAPADPSAAAVTEANLLESDRFWPIRTALVADLPIEGRPVPLKKGTEGVLIRVEDDGMVRVDFGRHGLYTIPPAKTDIVQRANEVRLGKRHKDGPVFTWAMGARIVRATGDEPIPYGMDKAFRKRGFLSVFVDIEDQAGYAAIAKALAPLNDRHGVLTMVFQKGRVPEAKMLELQKQVGWEAPFLVRHLSEPYAKILLPDGAERPYLMLQTNDGRLLLSEPWKAGLETKVEEVIDQAFSGTVTTAGK